MKKTLLIIAALVMSSVAFSQVQFGFGLATGSKSAWDKDDGDQTFGFGAHARALWNISEDFGLVGGFTYYLPTKIEGENLNMYGFNADGHYNFIKEDDMKVYGLAGFSLNFYKIDDTENAFGFHFGAGVTYKKFFAEAKYEFQKEIVDGYDHEGQVSAVIGIYIN